MRIHVERHRLHAVSLLLISLLVAAGTIAARSGNQALESIFVACQKIFFLFGDNLSFGTLVPIVVLVLVGAGVGNTIAGFFRDMIARNRLQKNAMKDAVLMTGEASVYLTHGIPYPAWTSGIFRPRIFVASESFLELSAGERKALLAHERMHVRNHDILKRVFLNGLHRLFWFIPIIGDVVKSFRFAQEVRADREALRIGGKRALCRLYLSASEMHTPMHVAGFAFSSPRLAEVLEGHVGKVSLSAPRLLFSVCMTGIVLFAGWGGIVQASTYEMPTTCAIIETMAPQSFTPLMGPFELHTPIPENACSQNLSC